jgi:hypothetical protein
MWNLIYMRREKDFFSAPITEAKEVGEVLQIAYANPNFYFRGTLDINLKSGIQCSSGTCEVTLDGCAIREISVVGKVERKPGLTYFTGTYESAAEPDRLWEIVVQYMPDEALTPSVAPQVEVKKPNPSTDPEVQR